MEETADEMGTRKKKINTFIRVSIQWVYVESCRLGFWVIEKKGLPRAMMMNWLFLSSSFVSFLWRSKTAQNVYESLIHLLFLFFLLKSNQYGVVCFQSLFTALVNEMSYLTGIWIVAGYDRIFCWKKNWFWSELFFFTLLVAELLIKPEKALNARCCRYELITENR